MSSAEPRHAFAETVPDDAAAPDAARVDDQDHNDNGDAAAFNTRADTKTNEELIAEAAAKLKITEGDVIIAVMGLTGVGKSTFIQHLSDSEIVVGHTLDPCTIHVAPHAFFLNDGRRAFLVDTPGFDDGKRTEAEILEEVSNFFAATYKMKITLAGVIYLHRISDNRMSGAMLKNLRMLKKLCGANCYSKIVLATTMWDRMRDARKAVQNEQQLGSTHEWWGDLEEEGATIMRQDDGATSAMKIVEHIMSFAEPAIMENQIERVVKNLALKDCESGKVIAEELIKQKEEHDKQMLEKREFYEEQIRNGNARAAEKLERSENEYKEKIEKINRSNEILARRFDESNEKLQRQIDEHNIEMTNTQNARIQADNALKATMDELAKLKAGQANREKELKADRESDKAAFNELLRVERSNYARKEADLIKRIDRANAIAEEGRRRTSKGVFAAIGGVAIAIAGAATLNPFLVAIGGNMAVSGGARAAYKASK